MVASIAPLFQRGLSLRSSPPFASSSSPVLILALADRQAPCRRWRLAPLVCAGRSLDQTFVGEPLARHAINEAVEPRQGMVLDVSFIEPEGKLVNVAGKVLWAGVMIDANQAALENGEDALNPVRGYAVADILASAVVDGIVVKPADAGVMLLARVRLRRRRRGFFPPIKKGGRRAHTNHGRGNALFFALLRPASANR